MKPSLFNHDHNEFQLPPHLAGEIVSGRIDEVINAVQAVAGYAPQSAKAQAVGFRESVAVATSMVQASANSEQRPVEVSPIASSEMSIQTQQNPLFAQPGIPTEQADSAARAADARARLEDLYQ